MFPVLFGLQLETSQLEPPEGGLLRPGRGWRDLSITARVTNQRGRTGVKHPRVAGLAAEGGGKGAGAGGAGLRGLSGREREREREVRRENKRMRGEAREQRRPLFHRIVLHREFAVWQVYIHQNRTKREAPQWYKRREGKE